MKIIVITQGAASRRGVILAQQQFEVGLLADEVGGMDLLAEQPALLRELFLITLAIMIELTEVSVLPAELKLDIFQFAHVFADAQVDITQFPTRLVVLVAGLSDLLAQAINAPTQLSEFRTDLAVFLRRGQAGGRENEGGAGQAGGQQGRQAELSQTLSPLAEMGSMRHGDPLRPVGQVRCRCRTDSGRSFHGVAAGPSGRAWLEQYPTGHHDWV